MTANHEPNDDLAVVTTTSDSRVVLEKIANALIASRLAACVQIGGPVTSIYRWREQVESAEEFVCNIKTSAKMFAEVENKIRESHNYDEPEIILIKIDSGSQSYLDWVKLNLA